MISLRFFRRIRLLPNLWLNLSRSGASVSVGVRGLRATFGRKNARLTASLPGSGLSITKVRPHAAPRPAAPNDEGRRLLERALRERGTGH